MFSAHVLLLHVVAALSASVVLQPASQIDESADQVLAPGHVDAALLSSTRSRPEEPVAELIGHFLFQSCLCLMKHVCNHFKPATVTDRATFNNTQHQAPMRDPTYSDTVNCEYR